MERRIELEHWKDAAISASNLSALESTLGLLDSVDGQDAVADGRLAVDYADRSGDAFQKMVNRTALADALFQRGRREGPGLAAGLYDGLPRPSPTAADATGSEVRRTDLTEARALLDEAERMQAERQPQFPLLYSLQGFGYCDLILAEAERAAWRCLLCACRPDQAQRRSGSTSQQSAGTALRLVRPTLSDAPAGCTEAERRATQTLEWAIPHEFLFDIALDHLTLARATLYRSILESEIGAEPSADEFQADESHTKARRHKDQDDTESLRACVPSCEPSPDPAHRRHRTAPGP
ncbi:hypothetical protein GC176_26950 [bacterium]|nr:hypothetical protein [bacterium]